MILLLSYSSTIAINFSFSSGHCWVFLQNFLVFFLELDHLYSFLRLKRYCLRCNIIILLTTTLMIVMNDWQLLTYSNLLGRQHAKEIIVVPIINTILASVISISISRCLLLMMIAVDQSG